MAEILNNFDQICQINRYLTVVQCQLVKLEGKQYKNEFEVQDFYTNSNLPRVIKEKCAVDSNCCKKRAPPSMPPSRFYIIFPLIILSTE